MAKYITGHNDDPSTKARDAMVFDDIDDACAAITSVVERVNLDGMRIIIEPRNQGWQVKLEEIKPEELQA